MGRQFARFVDGKLHPYNEETADAWRGMGRFDVVEVKLKAPRNGKFNGLYWTFLGHTAAAMRSSGTYCHAEDLHRTIKHHFGYYQVRDVTVIQSGEPVQRSVIDYTSTAFDAMTEAEFKDFARKAFDLIEANICPHLSDSHWAPKIDRIIAEFRGGLGE